MSDTQEIKSTVKEIQKDVKEGFSKVNGRISALEISEAKRQGREQIVGGGESDWKKMSFALLAVLSTGAGIGLAIAKGIFG